MSATIVRCNTPIVLVGAGHVHAGDARLVEEYGGRVVAADGGARWLTGRGVVPDAVIGDMDSAGDLEVLGVPAGRIHAIAEQDTTDFDKCLRSVDAPVIVCLGFAGPRLDHTLAVYNSLARHPDRRAIVVGETDVVFHAPDDLRLDLPPGTRLSLFPMARVEGRSVGLRWPIDRISFSPMGAIGTSNVTTGPVRLSLDGPGMLVITPREALRQVAEALGG